MIFIKFLEILIQMFQQSSVRRWQSNKEVIVTVFVAEFQQMVGDSLQYNLKERKLKNFSMRGNVKSIIKINVIFFFLSKLAYFL